MKIGFADEFGNNSFEFESQGSHFIVASILVKDSEQVSNLEHAVEQVRKKHFQTGEIKSNKVASNHKRRIKVLQDLVQLDFSVFAVIIDKRELYGEGFKFKKSFYKFTNNLLYKELFRTFPTIELNVDEHGTNDFMIEFRKYVERNHQRTLFSGIGFNQVNSSDSIIIQVADFVAGTLGYIFDQTKKSEYSNEFYEVLKPKISVLSNFPRKLTIQEFNDSEVDQTYDSRIAEVSFQRIFDMIEKGTNGDPQVIDQINFLKLILWLQRASPKNAFISTNEIMRHLNYTREKAMNEEFFRSKIIGNLRDKGILISSSPKGYKIPTSFRDIESFVKHGNRIILPMLNRIREARNAIRLISLNELDILENPAYSDLKNLLDK